MAPVVDQSCSEQIMSVPGAVVLVRAQVKAPMAAVPLVDPVMITM